MIGGIGFTNCLREWQFALISSSTASTWSSSTPTRIVAFPCFRNPPDELKRVARYSFSSSASTRVAASSLWTMAVTSFIVDSMAQGSDRGPPEPSAVQFSMTRPSSATRASPLQEGLHEAADGGVGILDRAGTVDDPEPIRLVGREALVRRADGLEEDGLLRVLEPVPLAPPPRARQPDLDRDVEEQREVRAQAEGREVLETSELGHVVPVAGALVGERRVEEARAHDPLATLERGPDDAGHVLRPAGGIEERV